MKSIAEHASIAFALRIGLVFYSYYQDHNYPVKYTDVDYHVFSDAAEYVYNGTSPFKRDTYRYSPLLALILCMNLIIHDSFGKLLFAMFDIVTGFLVWKILQYYKVDYEMRRMCTFMCFYNPLFAVISTRGSSDSIVNVLILLCILLLQKKAVFSLGLTYGFAVHFRMYPCIYAFAFYTALSGVDEKDTCLYSKLSRMFQVNKCRIKFVLSSGIGFILPSAVSYYFCGEQYINEAFLYHLLRKDVRHNFSPYFYFLYLSEGMHEPFFHLVAFLPFLVQLVLLLIVTWKYGNRETLPIGLFVQTCIFVSFNKVCTSQYFLWYLCLLPLVVPLLELDSKSVLKTLFLWLSAQVFWLFSAYLLEFQGENTFVCIWTCSLLVFVSNVCLIYSICSACESPGRLKTL